ncbi:hypothetical protein JW872_02320 [Candidatus Babeliales bacterium]|nr:hypothetical protein [Candidatus Babeliales bacterium]
MKRTIHLLIAMLSCGMPLILNAPAEMRVEPVERPREQLERTDARDLFRREEYKRFREERQQQEQSLRQEIEQLEREGAMEQDSALREDYFAKQAELTRLQQETPRVTQLQTDIQQTNALDVFNNRIKQLKTFSTESNPSGEAVFNACRDVTDLAADIFKQGLVLDRAFLLDQVTLVGESAGYTQKFIGELATQRDSDRYMHETLREQYRVRFFRVEEGVEGIDSSVYAQYKLLCDAPLLNQLKVTSFDVIPEFRFAELPKDVQESFPDIFACRIDPNTNSSFWLFKEVDGEQTAVEVDPDEDVSNKLFDKLKGQTENPRTVPLDQIETAILLRKALEARRPSTERNMTREQRQQQLRWKTGRAQLELRKLNEQKLRPDQVDTITDNLMQIYTELAAFRSRVLFVSEGARAKIELRNQEFVERYQALIEEWRKPETSAERKESIETEQQELLQKMTHRLLWNSLLEVTSADGTYEGFRNNLVKTFRVSQVIFEHANKPEEARQMEEAIFRFNALSDSPAGRAILDGQFGKPTTAPAVKDYLMMARGYEARAQRTQTELDQAVIGRGTRDTRQVQWETQYFSQRASYYYDLAADIGDIATAPDQLRQKARELASKAEVLDPSTPFSEEERGRFENEWIEQVRLDITRGVEDIRAESAEAGDKLEEATENLINAVTNSQYLSPKWKSIILGTVRERRWIFKAQGILDALQTALKVAAVASFVTAIVAVLGNDN